MGRLSRNRRNDPGISVGNPEFAPWIGYDKPSLFAEMADDIDTVEFDVPNYDLRRLMNARDPVSCVYAFRVAIIVVVASLFGLRMCPDCPHCNMSEKPCMDMFGSNANAMGGSAGRADGCIGAVEAQKAEGVLHIHMFIFFQMLHQHKNLHEIAKLIQERLASADAFKTYVDQVRCASYPDVVKFNEERADIEKSWPAYASDKSMCQVPHFIADRSMYEVPHLLQCDSVESWMQDGRRWA